jgi:hypothetical protein
MPKPSRSSRSDKIEIEPGADKRLANILKKALNTPPKHVPDKRTKKAN